MKGSVCVCVCVKSINEMVRLFLLRDPLVSRGNPSGPPVDSLRKDTLQYLLVSTAVVLFVS